MKWLELLFDLAEITRELFRNAGKMVPAWKYLPGSSFCDTVLMKQELSLEYRISGG